MSKKKLTSILSTVVAAVLALVMVLLTDSHVKKANNTHKQLTEGLSEMNAMLSELIDAANQGGAPQMLSYALNNKPRAKEAANKIRKVCDYFEKVRVPGSLKDELKAVRAAIPEMRSFADSFEAMFGGVMLESEFMSAVDQMGLRAERLVADDGFAYAEAKFMTKLNRLDSRPRPRFIWLEISNSRIGAAQQRQSIETGKITLEQ